MRSMYIVFFLMIRRPPRSTRTDTLFPYTTLFRSAVSGTVRNNAAAATRTGNFVIGLSPQEGPHRSGRSGDRFPPARRGRAFSPRPIGPASGSYFRPHPGRRRTGNHRANSLRVLGRAFSTEERHGGEECVSTLSTRGSTYH